MATVGVNKQPVEKEMEALKRKRTQLRRAFTLSADAVEKALQNKEETVEATFSTLSDCADDLFNCEAQFSDTWCQTESFDESLYEQDQDKALTYKSRWSYVRMLYTKYMKDWEKEPSLPETVKSRRMERNLQLPKLQLPTFDGDAKKWLSFWGQFKKIDADPSLDQGDKFQYLLQSMEPNSTAQKIVESYPPCGENYVKALQALKARFARDEILIETYVRGLLDLMQEKGQGEHNLKILPALYDSLQTHLQALETLGVTKNKYAIILFPIVESTLPNEVLRAWHRHRANGASTNDLSNLVNFLRLEVESEERIALAHSSTSSEPKKPTFCFVAETKSEKPKTPIFCIWCEKDTHCSAECHKAAKMSLEERLEYIKTKKACTICLRTNHPTKKCRSFPKCFMCRKRHSTLLCPQTENKVEDQKANNLHCIMKSTTVLQTVVIQVVSECNKNVVLTRALIDSGAQRSYIRKDLVQQLKLIPTRKEVLVHCLFGGKEEKGEECAVYDISVKSVYNDFKCQMSVVEQSNICSYLPKICSNTLLEQLKCKNITLTESTDSPEDIQLLIGADFSGMLMTGKVIQLDNGLTAVRLKLGWTVQGPITGVYSSVARMTTSLHCLSKIDISDLWCLETLGIRDPVEQNATAQQDAKVLTDFEDSISVNQEGRYEVCLPWRDVPRPQTNYQVAKKRLNSTTNRLLQLGKLEQYNEVFKQWLELGIIEVAPDQGIRGHYMPHHPVIKESSLTTKIRPVFDASAKDSAGISLNSCLEKGVNLLEQIPRLLIDFRKEKIGVIADIAKAFLQIALVPDDRDYMRFLWWSDLNDDSKGTITYRHQRVVFGVASSPFHLIATINHHLDSYTDELCDTAKKLKKSFYVDNCVTSVKSKEALNKFIKEARELMLAGKFDLRGWVSSPVTICDKTKFVSVLGVVWDIQEDTLRCNADLLKDSSEILTKRTLLSVTQRVFDPIGFTCATTIIPNMIIQKTWPKNLSWDEKLPADLAAEFKVWLDQAHLINECIVPRRLSKHSLDKCENSLHVFSDASKDAYAVCIFLRSKCNDNVELSLVQAKSRVTPVSKMHKITIPRLELIAATLGTRLAKTVVDALASYNCSVHYWADSSVVLTWIKGNGNWSVFVTNRVKEIKLATSTMNWRHIPGNLNPADLPSRGISPKGLRDSCWWKGPDWLRLDEQDWPAASFETDFSEVEREQRTTVNSVVSENDSFLNRLSYFSTYSKIVRMIGWMLRFRRNPKFHSRELTFDEFEYAEFALIKLIQTKNHDSMKMDTLEMLADDKGIIRLVTKLNLGTENVDFKCPIVLPGTDPIVQRMVNQRHVILLHAGVRILMNNLRERFWIIGLRRLCRKVVNNCVKCKRFKMKPCQPPTGSLPIGRMEMNTAFEVSGADLAGPLLLKSGNKAWIVLFTCATYRAVHLEVVETLSTAEFIMALRRFIARRGRVNCIYSDNGTNFRGLDNAFKVLNWDDILCFSSIARIKWNFLPPSAPWWGGFYERLIGVVKDGLRRVLGRASVSLTELYTILCDCEATINSRPLTYMSNGLDELRPLTPSMFIQPQVQHDVADLDEINRQTLNSRANYCQLLREDFRRRFKSEYLSTLVQNRYKLRHHELKVGDIVLIETEDRRRVNWPIGLVTEIVRGSDDVVRVVRVRTADSEKIRPVLRLYPLEISADGSDSLDNLGMTNRLDNVEPQQTDSVMDRQLDIQKSRSGRVLKFPQKLMDYV